MGFFGIAMIVLLVFIMVLMIRRLLQPCQECALKERLDFDAAMAAEPVAEVDDAVDSESDISE